ncbi:sugar ABC transporter substrate-binding protein [Anaerotalea alkaliphila]|uniref:Sugar ABC transporter substrate-binding protein n=1 Tax=Anaerotalea alkaliphila TaxID=2662126 RepID=A0A7X5KLW6_9FIRM|nr:substrate-binding domain-containing protein [Anaerotalea alkaliphila]NDL67144.1 sugar ABC transporter substrate-binding protein [Anaerotalea alkaliphila]
MRKRIIVGVAVFLSLVLLVSLGAGLHLSNRISQAGGESFWDSREKAEHHVLVLLDDENQAYGEEFFQGLEAAAAEYRVAVEVMQLDGGNYEAEAVSALERALFAKVDGVLLHGIRVESVVDKVALLQEEGIPVVTLLEDMPESRRAAHVGVNRYSVGQAAGESLVRSMEGVGKVAVIEQKSQGSRSEAENPLLLGLRDVLRENPQIGLSLVKYSDKGVLGAETAAAEIFRENPEINGIFCTDGQTTLGVVQFLVDRNLVGGVSLVGFGNDQEILEYIEKGRIVDAAIRTDYSAIGWNAVLAYYEQKTDPKTYNYYTTEIQVVDGENIQAQIREMEDANGENQ